MGKTIYKYAGAHAGYYIYTTCKTERSLLKFAAVAQAQSNAADELYYSGVYNAAADYCIVSLTSKPTDAQLSVVLPLGSWLYNYLKSGRR